MAAVMPALGFNKYKVDAYMHGKQYYFGTTLGTSYRINDNFSVYGGVRGVYATAHYYGYLKNIQINPGSGNNFVSAPAFFAQTAKALQPAVAVNPTLAPRLRQLSVLAAATQDVTLNTDQSGFGFAPIVGAHFHSQYFDASAKYEFRTRVAFKNESANSQSAENLTALAAYRDGAQVRSDIPALLTVGAQVRPIEGLRLNLGYHQYFDKQAKSGVKGAYRNELLKGGTKEYLFGAEYDLTKKWEISAGVQRTVYPNTNEYMNDLTFTTNSPSLGLGVGYQVNEKVKVNAGYFKTFYDTYNKVSQNYNNVANIIGLAEGADRALQLVESGAVKGSDTFTRTNQVFGLGVELTF
jgi:transporter, Ompp1/FadL/TodX family